MTHKGKVVVDQQGRVMGKDGKLLKDKKTGNFVFIDKDVKDKKKGKGPAADSGEMHRRNAKNHCNLETTSKLPFGKKSKSTAPVPVVPYSKKNTASAPAPAASQEGGTMSASEMSAWKSHVKGN